METSGTCSRLRADVLDVVAQLAVGEAVGGEAVDDAVGVAELVVEAGADDALRQACWRMSPTFLRTWYQMSGTSAGGVESFRLTKIVVWPALV